MIPTPPSIRSGFRGAIALVVSLGLASCTQEPRFSTLSDEGPRLGGRLVTTVRSEPATFNPVFVSDETSGTIVNLIHADLVRQNRVTFELEPALAESWQITDEGRLYALELRRGVSFSDGEPFDADDVLFTFEILLDPAIGSPQRDMLSPDGHPVELEKIDSHTVHFRLRQALAVGLLMFEGLAILPEHLLRPAYERGELAEAWNIGTPPEDLVGLGPFRLREYQPASRIVLERNPHYWRTDEDGLQLPYLDELALEITGSADAELLRFEAGASHIVDDLTAENFDLLKRDGLQLVDAGAGFAREILVWNLNDLSSKDLPEIEHHQSWSRQRPFRQAISKAIDRNAIVSLVYGGKAAPLTANVSPGNEKWINRDLPPPALDIDGARALLKSAGFERRGDRLFDSRGEAVELTLLTSSTNERRTKIGALIQQDLLLGLGIEIRLVPLDQAAIINRLLNTFEYDAMLLNLGDGDPNAQTNILASNGGTHIWDMQPTLPLSDWQVEIDSLMLSQRVEMSFAERKGMWDRVQVILSTELPVIELVSSHVLAAAQPEVGGFEPARFPHYTLWNAESLYLRGP